jgi:hypothetical protein
VPATPPADESFFSTAPKRWTDTFHIDRPAAEVWAAITADDALHWCRAISVHWTSPRPFGVGTTRQVKVFGGVLSAHERFFVWEEGRRKAFHITSANLPLFRRLAEDYVVEPEGDAACRFTWTIAAEPTTLGKPGGLVNDALMKSLFKDTRKHFSAR